MRAADGVTFGPAAAGACARNEESHPQWDRMRGNNQARRSNPFLRSINDAREHSQMPPNRIPFHRERSIEQWAEAGDRAYSFRRQLISGRSSSPSSLSPFVEIRERIFNRVTRIWRNARFQHLHSSTLYSARFCFGAWDAFKIGSELSFHEIHFCFSKLQISSHIFFSFSSNSHCEFAI